MYDKRSLIENTLFRELKQAWCLECYPKKTEAAVRGHVLLTVTTFTLANAYRTKQGQVLAGRGMRRYRAEEQGSKVIVFAGEHYALFDIEQVLTVLGVHIKHRFTTSRNHAIQQPQLPHATCPL